MYYNAELEHESEGGRTPLMKACRAGHICTVKFLIGKGADVNRQTTNNDHTPLSLACAGGHQAVVELLLKSGADPFHKLKDNSTMLIEAAKGGHIGVVQLLLDYPQSMATNAVINNIVASNNGHIQAQPQQLQQQSFMITQQQQQQTQAKQQVVQPQHLVSPTQQQQLLTAPPGLHEVPVAVRVSNQQLFHHQQLQPSTKDNNLDQQQIISNQQIVTSTCNIPANQPEAMNQMRIEYYKNFSEGPSLGLAYGQANIVNQTTVNNNNGGTIIVPNTTLTANQTIVPAGVQQQQQPPQQQQQVQQLSSNKQQKSLLRQKNRQVPSSFESNLTTSEAQQVRSQPVGEDENLLNISNATLGNIDEQQKKLFQEYHGVSIFLSFYEVTLNSHL